MKDTDITKMSDEVVNDYISAIEDFVEEVIAPLEDIGSPEKLLKKPYEQWTREDLMLLAQIYGDKPDSVLNKFIFKKEYEALKKLELGLEVK